MLSDKFHPCVDAPHLDGHGANDAVWETKKAEVYPSKSLEAKKALTIPGSILPCHHSVLILAGLKLNPVNASAESNDSKHIKEHEEKPDAHTKVNPLNVTICISSPKSLLVADVVTETGPTGFNADMPAVSIN